MIWLSFKRWSSSSTSMFVWQRIYRHGYKWTPFIMARPRYVPGYYADKSRVSGLTPFSMKKPNGIKK